MPTPASIFPAMKIRHQSSVCGSGFCCLRSQVGSIRWSDIWSATTIATSIIATWFYWSTSSVRSICVIAGLTSLFNATED